MYPAGLFVSIINYLNKILASQQTQSREHESLIKSIAKVLRHSVLEEYAMDHPSKTTVIKNGGVQLKYFIKLTINNIILICFSYKEFYWRCSGQEDPEASEEEGAHSRLAAVIQPGGRHL